MFVENVLKLLKERLHEFSESGIHMIHEKGYLLFGVGCWKWSWPIINEVACIWLNDKSLRNLREKHWDLPMIVGAVVHNFTRDKFSWNTVSQIIEATGRYNLRKSDVESFCKKYPLASSKFGYCGEDWVNVKRSMQETAKAILWLEALSFLENEGFGERLK